MNNESHLGCRGKLCVLPVVCVVRGVIEQWLAWLVASPEVFADAKERERKREWEREWERDRDWSTTHLCASLLFIFGVVVFAFMLVFHCCPDAASYSWHLSLSKLIWQFLVFLWSVSCLGGTKKSKVDHSLCDSVRTSLEVENSCLRGWLITMQAQMSY